MRFYEFETKRILAKHGIPVAKGAVVATAAEAEQKAQELGCPVVLKAQVLYPGKAKADAVKTAATPAEARKVTVALRKLVVGGRPPKGVLVEKHAAGGKPYCISMSYDGVRKLPVMVAGAMRCDDIEGAVISSPDKFTRRHFSALRPFAPYLAKEVATALGLKGSELTRASGLIQRLAQVLLQYDLTQLDVHSLVRQEDGSFIVDDCFADMEGEGRSRQKTILDELGIKADDKRLPREPTPFEIEGAKIDAEDPRGVAGPVVEFDGNIGLVIGAGGGSLTLTDAVRKHGGRPANYAAIGGNPSVRKAQRLTKAILSKPGVKKIAVMSNVVSNTRADLVARGVIKGVLELGLDPKETIAIFRVPGAWEADAFKILSKYGVEFCDRSVSMSEAARRAVAKIQAAKG
jgi:succinyl-CoA synthetase beta subunit/citryl-CoA synthetase large subunit